jgi:hypothetical protein
MSQQESEELTCACDVAVGWLGELRRGNVIGPNQGLALAQVCCFGLRHQVRVGFFFQCYTCTVLNRTFTIILVICNSPRIHRSSSLT